ncbi:MAG: PEGA domain-containing protein [Betaproteobacteria bacterium]|nr:MAG: PEGA domain-containing protein [Betaproteobacteria bacterium]
MTLPSQIRDTSLFHIRRLSCSRRVFETSVMTQENMLASYKILHELGRGSMGTVYAARDRETGGVVALKRLDPALGKSDASFAERFLKHARSARLLKHHNIVRIHEASEVGGTVYVAMELLEGRNLRHILDAGPLPVARAIQIAHDIACGLAHAHLEGVVHGGLKPSNVIVLRSRVVKITDFGIGQLGQAAPLSEAPAGGLSYMSPEQLRGEPLDHRCDIFALGALFYEMLGHRPPFEGGSAKEIVENILHARPPLPSELNPHAPRALDAIVFSMLAGQPVDRMPGVPILLRDLQRLEEGLGFASDASAGADEPTASVPPPGPEPELRTPDPNRFREPEEFQQRNRIADSEAFDHDKAIAMMERESGRQRSSGSRPAIAGALTLVLAVLGIGLAGFMYYSPGPGERGVAASRMPETPATAPAAPEASPPPAPASAAPAQALPPAMRPPAKVPKPQPGGTARLVLAVSPRGEIYIDGKHHGTTPPITTLDLEPGMHRVEVRSGSRTPYLTYMTLQAGDVRRIQYGFNTDRAVYPPKSASWQSSNRAAR